MMLSLLCLFDTKLHWFGLTTFSTTSFNLDTKIFVNTLQETLQRLNKYKLQKFTSILHFRNQCSQGVIQIPVGSSGSLSCRTCTRSNKRKKKQENTASNKQESTPWVYVVRQCTYIHGKCSSSSSHWSWNITSSIQAEASLIPLGFSFQNLSQSPSSFSLLNSIFLQEKLYFSTSQKLSLHYMIKSIYTL